MLPQKLAQKGLIQHFGAGKATGQNRLLIQTFQKSIVAPQSEVSAKVQELQKETQTGQANVMLAMNLAQKEQSLKSYEKMLMDSQPGYVEGEIRKSIWERIFGGQKEEQVKEKGEDLELKQGELDFELSTDEYDEEVYERARSSDEYTDDDNDNHNGGEMMPIPGMFYEPKVARA